MLKLGLPDQYSYPVTVEIVVDGGKRNTFTFDAVFRRLSFDEHRELLKKVESDQLDDADFCREALIGWKGVQDEDGNDLPFSEGNRDRLLNVWPVPSAIAQAYMDSRSRKGTVKN